MESYSKPSYVETDQKILKPGLETGFFVGFGFFVRK